MHRLVLVQMRQDDAVEAPVGAKVEQHELAVGLSLGQRRLNVLVGVRVPVIRALRAPGCTHQWRVSGGWSTRGSSYVPPRSDMWHRRNVRGGYRIMAASAVPAQQVSPEQL